jgi:membrane-bound lytic murein transglycosylase D
MNLTLNPLNRHCITFFTLFLIFSGCTTLFPDRPAEIYQPPEERAEIRLPDAANNADELETDIPMPEKEITGDIALQEPISLSSGITGPETDYIQTPIESDSPLPLNTAETASEDTNNPPGIEPEPSYSNSLTMSEPETAGSNIINTSENFSPIIIEAQSTNIDNSASAYTLVLPEPKKIEPEPVVEEIPPPTNQELIDSALDYCNVSNEFWEQGDLNSAIDALDKAYSIILQVNGGSTPEAIQQKEDNRLIFLESYIRSGEYRPAIVRALNEAGLPEELSWLPLIESGFKVKALSSARALGMWQFIASTGYRFGMKRDSWVDERMDPEKSTTAAIGYMTELHHMFGDWTTVLAAYNCGENRVLSKIKSQRLNYLDNFWDLYTMLPSETAFYVPKFLATLHIINDPQAYGFDELPEPKPEQKFEKITVNKQLHLTTIANNLDVEYALMKGLNAELRYYVTPNRPYELKVPPGKGDILLAKIDDIPVYVPPVPSYVTHRVRSGESLSVIAKRYRSSVKAIMNMNNLRSSSFIRSGWKLKIPTRGASSVSAPPAYVSIPAGGELKYTVQKGDSLWLIANRYHTTVNGIKTLNNLKRTTLQVGQVLVLSPGGVKVEPGTTIDYQVMKGDSPYLIAKKYQMNLYDFLRLNNMTIKSTIYPGQIVKVVPKGSRV